MIVLYYTSTHFLDVAIETIQSIKQNVELHVVIEISPNSKKSTIVDVEHLNNYKDIEDCEEVLGIVKWNYLKKYFEGVASVRFLIHKNKRMFSPESYRTANKLGKHIKKLKVDIIHFDTITERAFGLYPYIRSKKIFITIHDPKAHSGEYSWKKLIRRFVFFRLAAGYFFYSNFACNQFRKYYPSIVTPTYVIRFQPTTYISQFLEKERLGHTILFFGRLSFYKGIDMLLKAIPNVLEKFPDEKFIIAGNPELNYKIELKNINQYQNNIQFITKYLSTDELIKCIQNAKFVVCPYRDATQSGVLMTSFAAGKMVVATNVGAFPEYIEDNVNGLLAEPTTEAIADRIIEALENEKYKEIEKKIISFYSEEINCYNQNCILNAYQLNNLPKRLTEL